MTPCSSHRDKGECGCSTHKAGPCSPATTPIGQAHKHHQRSREEGPFDQHLTDNPKQQLAPHLLLNLQPSRSQVDLQPQHYIFPLTGPLHPPHKSADVSRIPNETTTVLKRIRIFKRFSTSRKHERGAGNDSVSTTTTAAPMMSLLQYLSVRTGLLAEGIPSLPMPSPPPAIPDPLRSNAVTRDVTVIKTYEPEVIETSADDDCDGNSKAGRNQFRARTVKGGNNGVALRQYAEATLGGGSLRKVVKLPEGEDENEWLAVNMVDFYNQINLLYGAITEFCSPKSCPEMKATDEFEYLWQDSDQYKKPTHMSAPDYIEHLMTWVQSTIDNETMMPSRIGVPFPKNFPSHVRQIFKRMYRVYAHVYCHHYSIIRELGLEPHLNTSFKQYVLFVDEHKLASGKDFYGPLNDLAEKMIESD